MTDHLILGASGLIGRKFIETCLENGINCSGTKFSKSEDNLIPFNLLETEKICAFLDDIAPGIIINCAGLAGGVDYCELHPEIGSVFYVGSTEVIVEWCRKNGAILVYFSTDCVFDGKNPPYAEEDRTNPLNLYGRFKLEAENLIKRNLKQYIIVRTTNVYDWDPTTRTPNFLMQVYRNINENRQMKVPSFLFGPPTFAGDLADAVWELIVRQIYGLFHIVGEEFINRFDWAVKLCKHAGFDPGFLVKVDHPLPGRAPRPHLSILKAEKFRRISKLKFHNIDEGLRIFVRKMNSPSSDFTF